MSPINNTLQEELDIKNMVDGWNIDEDIYNIILLFNQLGMKTKFSCSGHSNTENEENFYIMFDENTDIPQLLSWFKDFTEGNLLRQLSFNLHQWHRWLPHTIQEKKVEFTQNFMLEATKKSSDILPYLLWDMEYNLMKMKNQQK